MFFVVTFISGARRAPGHEGASCLRSEPGSYRRVPSIPDPPSCRACPQLCFFNAIRVSVVSSPRAHTNGVSSTPTLFDHLRKRRHCALQNSRGASAALGEKRQRTTFGYNRDSSRTDENTNRSSFCALGAAAVAPAERARFASRRRGLPGRPRRTQSGLDAAGRQSDDAWRRYQLTKRSLKTKNMFSLPTP